MDYLFLKWLHILSSTVLFGTGVGSAYYLFFTSLTRDTHAVAAVTRQVVRADWCFTAPTAVLQPASGFYLVHLAGIPLDTDWVAWSIALFVLAIACWLPVVWIQIRMRDLALAAVRETRPLSGAYWRLFWTWTALGSVAFVAFLGIFWLMVAKPVGL